jgi:hypothetical protein
MSIEICVAENTGGGYNLIGCVSEAASVGRSVSMTKFPRTTVGGISVPRLICGTNWFLGYSHTSSAKDLLIRELFDTPAKMARVVEVFARRGCNAVMGPLSEFVSEALVESEQRTGSPMIWICTPGHTDADKPDAWRPAVDAAKKLGAAFCFPHQCITDPRIDLVNRRLDPELSEYLNYVREMEMIPGLSTHTPDAIICADASGADVESYTLPYNCAGFLCHVETDWAQKVIHEAHKPVMTIKPLAAGRVLPPTGLSFVWNTIRDCDMVTVGTMSTYEAEEVIEISLACLEHRKADVGLQFTRSKTSLARGDSHPFRE